MTIKRTFATTTILASIVMVAISGTSQSVYAQMFSDAVPEDAKVLLMELVDGSFSISASDFLLQKEGLKDGLQKTYDALLADPNPKRNLFGESYIVIIQFSTSGSQAVECSVEIVDQAALNVLFACIDLIVQIDGTTCISCAFNLATAQLTNAIIPPEFRDTDPQKAHQIIDLITDGGPFPESEATAIAAKDAAVLAGVDRIVALGIEPANAVFLVQVVDPVNNPPVVVLSAPFNPLVLPVSDGFVILIDDFTEFAEAIEFKLVATIVDPCTLEILPPECVGGEFLPVDSSALLIAGLSANMSLIVPIALGIAGVSAYLIRSRMNKD